ncbi:MAG: hypothetical protein WD972_03015 [Candidatus Andersenbacteria bacterium]
MEQKRFIALFLAALGLVGIIILLFWAAGFRSEPAATPSAEPFLIENAPTPDVLNQPPNLNVDPLPPGTGLLPQGVTSPLVSPTP